MKNNKPVFNLVANSKMWKPITALRSTNKELITCPRCSSRLYKRKTIIPHHNRKDIGWSVPGLTCQKCNCLYISNFNDVANILKDNKNASHFTLDGKNYSNYTKDTEEELRKKAAQKKALEKMAKRDARRLKQKAEQDARRAEIEALLMSIPDSAILLNISCAEETTDYIITYSWHEDTKNLVCYKSEKGRELLTAAYYSKRNKSGEINGKPFHVNYTYERTASYPIIPSSITIKPGAGYYNGRESVRNQYVDLLIFSPFTQRYEICKASYDGYEKTVSMDIRRFRSFIHKYGYDYHLVPLEFPAVRRTGSIIDDLRAESVLKGYGYSVAEKANLSRSERQTILAEIVDLKILSIQQIIKYIDFFLQLHNKESDYFARIKWEEDKTFISDYHHNPKRFLISQ